MNLNPKNWFKKAATEPRVMSTRRGWADEWKSNLNPTPIQLGEYFRGIASACAKLNSQAVAKIPFKLYAKTATGQKSPRVPHGNAPSWIQKSHTEDMTEIYDHPYLDLINDNSMGTQYDLIELTQTYIDMLGSAYWWIPTGSMGLPNEIQLLDATHMEPVVTSSRLQFFRYNVGVTRIIPIDEVMWFRNSALINPYINVTSPAIQAWNTIKLTNGYESLELAIVNNNGRPDMALITSQPLGDTERSKLERKYNSKFRRSGNGKIIVMSSVDGELKEMQWQPRDLATMKIADHARGVIANNFSVPIPLLDSKQAPRAQIEGSFYQHQVNAVEPRCIKIANMLTTLAQRYDERLIVISDPCVTRDEQIDASVYTQYASANIMTTNEVRAELGLDPIDGGDEITKPSPQPEKTPEQEEADNADGL